MSGEDVAARIAFAIVEDIEDRSGLGDEWQQLDDDIQGEIVQKWMELIKRELREA